MSGAYAEAMASKVHALLDHLEDVYGADFSPRVVGLIFDTDFGAG